MPRIEKKTWSHEHNTRLRYPLYPKSTAWWRRLPRTPYTCTKGYLFARKQRCGCAFHANETKIIRVEYQVILGRCSTPTCVIHYSSGRTVHLLGYITLLCRYILVYVNCSSWSMYYHVATMISSYYSWSGDLGKRSAYLLSCDMMVGNSFSIFSERC